MQKNAKKFGFCFFSFYREDIIIKTKDSTKQIDQNITYYQQAPPLTGNRHREHGGAGGQKIYDFRKPDNNSQDRATDETDDDSGNHSTELHR